jgi:hypothetical protein
MLVITKIYSLFYCTYMQYQIPCFITLSAFTSKLELKENYEVLLLMSLANLRLIRLVVVSFASIV